MPPPPIVSISPFSLRRFASDEVHHLLTQNGLAGIDEVISKASSGRSRHRGRAIWSTALSAADGSTIRAYVKMSWGRTRFWPRMTDLKTGQWTQSLPVREWHGLHRLRALGLNVPEPLAVFHSGLLRYRAAVIVREIPPKQSLFEMIRSGYWRSVPDARQEEILRDVVARLSVIHDAGLGWRGASAVHVFPEQMPGGVWRVWLLDCEGIHPRATNRTRRRDLSKFVKSLRQSGADVSTVRRAERLIDSTRGSCRRRVA